MISRTRIGLRAALVALAALGWWAGANAQPMTPANTLIENRATVNYSVGSQPQTLIESSPTGNTTPGAGAGADTEFVVDNRVDLTVAEVSSNATVTAPGAPNAALAFTVTNTGNAQQGYALTFLEEVGTTLFGNADNANFGNLVIRVDEDPSSGNGTGNDTYDGTETATAIDRLNPNQQVTVFIVSPVVPLTLVNANFANVNLTARVAVPGTNGATLATQSTGANNPAVVEIVFADDPLGRRRHGKRRRPIRGSVRGAHGDESAERHQRRLQQHEPARHPGCHRRVHDHRRERQHHDGRERPRDPRSDSGQHDVREQCVRRLERRCDHGRRGDDLHRGDAGRYERGRVLARRKRRPRRRRGGARDHRGRGHGKRAVPRPDQLINS